MLRAAKRNANKRNLLEKYVSRSCKRHLVRYFAMQLETVQLKKIRYLSAKAHY